jgi:hypothetical protein
MITRLSFFALLVSFLLSAVLVPVTPLADRDVVELAARKITKNFHLFAAMTKSIKDPNAIALNLVDPYYQPNYLLRAQEGAGALRSTSPRESLS